MFNFRIVFVLTFAMIFVESPRMWPSPQHGEAAPPSATKEQKLPRKIYNGGYRVTAPVFVSQTQPSGADAAERRIKHDGNVALAIVIEADGTVSDVKVEKFSDKDLVEIAVNRVTTWKFKPATKAGKPVAVRELVEINFHKH